MRLIERKQGATNRELNAIAFRYGARLKELRDQGHSIVTEKVNNDGLYLYKLIK